MSITFGRRKRAYPYVVHKHMIAVGKQADTVQLELTKIVRGLDRYRRKLTSEAVVAVL